jgi:hypothetical protein
LLDITAVDLCRLARKGLDEVHWLAGGKQWIFFAEFGIAGLMSLPDDKK